MNKYSSLNKVKVKDRNQPNGNTSFLNGYTRNGSHTSIISVKCYLFKKKQTMKTWKIKTDKAGWVVVDKWVHMLSFPLFYIFEISHNLKIYETQGSVNTSFYAQYYII